MTAIGRTISEVGFREALTGLNTIASVADALQLEIERLDPVEVHKALGRIASIATIIGQLHLSASPEEWRAAAKESKEG